jgi:hypothetical protein
MVDAAKSKRKGAAVTPAKAAPRKTARKGADTIYHRRSAALSLIQMAGRWEPFYGPTGALLWRLPSESGAARGSTQTYTVFVGEGAEPTVSCTCPDFTRQRAGRIAGDCKHIIAVKTYQRAAKSHARHQAALAALPGGSRGR